MNRSRVSKMVTLSVPANLDSYGAGFSHIKQSEK